MSLSSSLFGQTVDEVISILLGSILKNILILTYSVGSNLLLSVFSALKQENTDTDGEILSVDAGTPVPNEFRKEPSLFPVRVEHGTLSSPTGAGNHLSFGQLPG